MYQCGVDISISIVSHLQIGLIVDLLADIEKYCKGLNIELILTLNVDENLPFAVDAFSFPIKLFRNVNPMGFGANHNQAFGSAAGKYFCVINPDIRLNSNPFGALIVCFQDPLIGVAAPLILGEKGAIEDSARRFPSPLKIVEKVFGRGKGSDYEIKEALVFPDWVGGMFMLFPQGIFDSLGGFDERYFLYYEDVDICGRLRLQGCEVVVCPQVKAIHHAQRSSHRSLKYLNWHLRSLIRFFLSPVYWRLRFRPQP